MRTREILVGTVIGVLAMATPATAQSVSGKTLCFSDGGSATYSPSGAYTYRGAAGGVFQGRWTQTSKQVCVKFTNGTSRCDSIDLGAGTLSGARGSFSVNICG